MTEAFRLYCEYSLCFDLEGFDRWLDELGDCGAKRELTERREKAYRAFLTRANEHGKIQMNLDDDSADDIKGHLEWCLLRWRGIQTAVVVGPIARIGAQVRQGGQKGNEEAYGTEEEKQTLRGEYQRTVDHLAATTDLKWTAIKDEAAKQHGVSAKTIYRYCDNPRK